MKKFTALALVAGLGTAASAQYSLTYDANTGDVTISRGGALLSYAFERSGGDFIAANHVPYLGGALVTSSNTTISNTNLSGATGEMSASLGAILPAGLTEDEYVNGFTKNNYAVALGEPGGSFELVYVPEPASVALLGLGGLLVARRRRA